jgi:hypothetical protein
MFSRRSWFRLWVSRQSKPALFNVFHTYWTAQVSIIHPFWMELVSWRQVFLH